MEQEIIALLDEASAYNMRNEVRNFAEILMSKYYTIFNRPVQNHYDFYNLAFKTLVTTVEDEELQNRIPMPGEIYASYEEIYAAMCNLAELISNVDYKINSENIRLNLPLTPMVFVVTDIYSMLTYHQLMSLLELCESPITFVCSDEIYSRLDTISKDSLVYVLSYHENNNTENVLNYLTSKRLCFRHNITSIEVLGVPAIKDDIQHISLVYCNNQDLIIEAHGFGKPDQNYRNSELEDIFINN